jgi:hypothetical protein
MIWGLAYFNFFLSRNLADLVCKTRIGKSSM